MSIPSSTRIFATAQDLRYVKKTSTRRCRGTACADDRGRAGSRAADDGRRPSTRPRSTSASSSASTSSRSPARTSATACSINTIAAAGKPAIMSTGGSSLADIDELVGFFADRHIPLAINHCVSIYPSEDDELELNQIDFLRAPLSRQRDRPLDARAPRLVALGRRSPTARAPAPSSATSTSTQDGIPVSSYCTQPEQADVWFQAFKRAKAMCGGAAVAKRVAAREGGPLPRCARARRLRASAAVPAGEVAVGRRTSISPCRCSRARSPAASSDRRGCTLRVAADAPIAPVPGPSTQRLELGRLIADRDLSRSP